MCVWRKTDFLFLNVDGWMIYLKQMYCTVLLQCMIDLEHIESNLFQMRFNMNVQKITRKKLFGNNDCSQSSIFDEGYEIHLWNLTFTDCNIAKDFNAYRYETRLVALLVLYSTIFVLSTIWIAQNSKYALTYLPLSLPTAIGSFLCTLMILIFKAQSRTPCTMPLSFLYYTYATIFVIVSRVIYFSENMLTLTMLHLCIVSVNIGLGPCLHIPFSLICSSTAVIFGISIAEFEATLRASSFDKGSNFNSTIHVTIASGCFLAALVAVYRSMLSTCLLFSMLQKYKKNNSSRVKEEVDELKKQYIAQTMHDIGTPLATLSLGHELLKSPLSDASGDILEILETNECAIEMMNLTRRKALYAAKMAANESMKPNYERVNIRKIVLEKCRRVMTGYNTGNAVVMEYNVSNEIATHILTDKDWIWEMLCNYLSNAKKFTNRGQIVTNVFLNNMKDTIEFQVKDTGIGIPDHKKKILFQPFTQLQRGCGGTGLGLYGVKLKAEALGGTTGVMDNKDYSGGSLFWFKLPYIPDIDMENSPGSKEEDSFSFRDLASSGKKYVVSADKKTAGESDVKKKSSILYVEDSPSLQKHMKRYLTQQDYRVETAETGSEAIDKMKEKLYQIVFLDLGLPDMSGMDVLKNIRSWESASKNGMVGKQFICILSGSGVNEDKIMAAKLGCDAFLSKPPSINKILSTIKAANSKDMFFVETKKDLSGSTFLPSLISPTSARLKPVKLFHNKILVVEDETTIAKYVRTMLTKRGYDVDVAPNGDEGLRLMKQGLYIIVFCDLNMPVMDGYECVQRFREWEIKNRLKKDKAYRQTIIAVSACDLVDDRNAAFKSGFDKFIAKPIKMKHLLAEIENIKMNVPKYRNEMQSLSPLNSSISSFPNKSSNRLLSPKNYRRRSEICPSAMPEKSIATNQSENQFTV